MEVLPGAHSTITRWRRMAQHWCSTGVDRRSAAFQPFYWDQAGQVLALGPGAVWVNGFYAENSQGVIIATPGNNGIVVARYQPELQEVRLVWRPGVVPGGEIKDPEGWYETPLIWLGSPEGWRDMRRLVPIPVTAPPVTEMPPWVPRGIIGVAIGPGATFPPGAGNVLVAYPSTYPRFVPGRAYRVTCHTWWTSGGGSGQVRFWTSDAVGLRSSIVLWGGFADSSQGVVRTASVVVPNFGASAVAVITAEGGTPWPFLTFEAGSSRIEIEDVGM